MGKKIIFIASCILALILAMMTISYIFKGAKDIQNKHPGGLLKIRDKLEE